MSKNVPKTSKIVNQKTTKISVRVSKELKKNIPMSVVKDGYNFREKSKWLENVLDIFLARNEWEGALLSELVVRSETIDVFSLSKAALQNLDLKIAEVDGRNKSLGASRSSVIRAAINRHLLGI